MDDFLDDFFQWRLEKEYDEYGTCHLSPFSSASHNKFQVVDRPSLEGESVAR